MGQGIVSSLSRVMLKALVSTLVLLLKVLIRKQDEMSKQRPFGLCQEIDNNLEIRYVLST